MRHDIRNFEADKSGNTPKLMTQLQKYAWLIETIRRAGMISYKDLSLRWMHNKDLSDYNPLPRATFNRWKDAIYSMFGIIISCNRKGGYLYYIENPEDIDNNELKKWMLDTFATGNIIGENLSLKDRIVVDRVPSGQTFLTPILKAMEANHVVGLTYKSFKSPKAHTFPVKPYGLRLFENRWYLLAYSDRYKDMRLYGLDRIEGVEETDETFEMPKGFVAAEYFAKYYGVVTDKNIEAERIVVRAYGEHKEYMKSLPLHHSQTLIADRGEYADFELYLAPTYDFIMKLLQMAAMVEVVSPGELRAEMRAWIEEMYKLYKDDNK